MKSYIKYFLLLLTLFVTDSYAQTAGKQLTDLLKNINSMQAQFTQTLVSAKGKSVKEAHGNMAVQRPGKFRWQFTSPVHQLLIADGNQLWVYDQALKQATVKQQSEGLGNTPASLLSSKVDLLTNYFSVQFYNGSYFLRPKYNKTMFKLIEMRFKGNQLVSLNLQDDLGQHSQIVFSSVSTNRMLNPALFRFKPAADVDVIRDR